MKTKPFITLWSSAVIAMGSCTHEQVILQNDAALKNCNGSLKMESSQVYSFAEYKDNIRPKDLERAERLLRIIPKKKY